MGKNAHPVFRCVTGALVALVLLCTTVEQIPFPDRGGFEADLSSTDALPALYNPDGSLVRAILPAGVTVPVSMLDRLMPSGPGAWFLDGSVPVAAFASHRKEGRDSGVQHEASDAYPRLHFLHIYRC